MALDMKIEKLETSAGLVEVVVIDGSLTMGTNLKTVDNNLQAMVERGVERLILDLSGCPYCDSAGLGLLMHLSGLMTSKGAVLRICNASDRVNALLKMTRTDTLLPLDVDRAVSLSSFQSTS